MSGFKRKLVGMLAMMMIVVVAGLTACGQTAEVTGAASISLEQRSYHPDLKKKGGSVYLYEEVGDTAIVTFDEFSVERDDYRKEADLEHPNDTLELIAHAHERVTRKDSPIKTS